MRSSLSQPGSATVASLAEPGPLEEWEGLWAPYDEATYAAVLAAIEQSDVVLDIGAGDLRLARRIAELAKEVVAWEIQPELLAAWNEERGAGSGEWRVESGEHGTQHGEPHNLNVVCTDARVEPVPAGVTVAVLLMRHCTHYAWYVDKLRSAGCGRLITNARWGMGVEVVDLGPGVPFDSVGVGWYACRRCGAVGFAGSDARQVNASTFEHVVDVEGCPSCLRQPIV